MKSTFLQLLNRLLGETQQMQATVIKLCISKVSSFVSEIVHYIDQQKRNSASQTQQRSSHLKIISEQIEKLFALKVYLEQLNFTFNQAPAEEVRQPARVSRVSENGSFDGWVRSFNQTVHSCPQCLLSFPDVNELLLHQAETHAPQCQRMTYFQCPECDRKEKRSTLLAEHIMECHKTSQEQGRWVFTCPYTGRRFSTRVDLVSQCASAYQYLQ